MLKAAGGGGGGGVATSLVVGTTAVTGGAAYAVLREDGSQKLAADANLTFGGAAAGTGLTLVGGIATTDVNLISGTQTLNNAGVTFTGVKLAFSVTAVAAGSNLLNILGGAAGATSFLTLSTAGAFAVVTGTSSLGGSTIIRANEFVFNNNGVIAYSSNPIGWASGTVTLTSSGDTLMMRGGVANSIVFAGATASAGAVTSRVEINKSVTGIADNAATATFTVTVPNAAHSAGGKFILKGAAGAGGAIGADEFSAEIEYDWVVTRTAGVNAVATLSAALLTAITASVAGGATPTISAALSAISGAVGATNTFTLNVTIHAITGSSTNHTCFGYGTLLNDNATGVTIA